MSYEEILDWISQCQAGIKLLDSGEWVLTYTAFGIKRSRVVANLVAGVLEINECDCITS